MLMDASLIYAVIVGSLLMVFTLQHISNNILIFFQSRILAWVLKHLVWPIIVPRQRFLPPISRFDAISQFCYWCATAAFNIVKTSTLSKAGLRAGSLAVFQIIPLMAGNRLSFTADLMGLSYRGIRYIHSSMGLMVVAQSTCHVVLMIKAHRLDLRDIRERFGIVVSDHML
jgi:hypothetical protein